MTTTLPAAALLPVDTFFERESPQEVLDVVRGRLGYLAVDDDRLGVVRNAAASLAGSTLSVLNS